MVSSRFSDHVRSLVADGAVLAVPSAPGIAPLKKAPAEEVESYRNRILQLSVIAGPAGLPQVSFISLTSDPIIHLLWSKCAHHRCGIFRKPQPSAAGAAGEPGVILRWNFFRSSFSDIEVKSCRNRVICSMVTRFAAVEVYQADFLGRSSQFPWILEVHRLKTYSHLLSSFGCLSYNASNFPGRLLKRTPFL